MQPPPPAVPSPTPAVVAAAAAAAAAAGARMRRRETGPGERRGWIQHGGAEPEPREETWEIKFLEEFSGDYSCCAGILESIAYLSPQHGGPKAESKPGVARRAW